jgi:hypothetical protein
VGVVHRAVDGDGGKLRLRALVSPRHDNCEESRDVREGRLSDDLERDTATTITELPSHISQRTVFPFAEFALRALPLHKMSETDFIIRAKLAAK